MGEYITLNQQLNFGAAAAPFGTETAVALTTSQVVTLSQGVWVVSLGWGGGPARAAAVQYSPDSGTTWRNVYCAGEGVAPAGGQIYSDGFNVRITGGAATIAATPSLTTTYYAQVKALF